MGCEAANQVGSWGEMEEGGSGQFSWGVWATVEMLELMEVAVR